MAEEYNYLIKTIVIGNPSVGKATLMRSIAKGFFQEDYSMTIGVNFHTKTIDLETEGGPKRCKLQLWVLGGQERFSYIRPMYYRGSLGVILIFDLTNTDSFEHLPIWIHEIRENVKLEIPILLVGNKSDLFDQRAVSRDEIDRFRKKFNLKYIEISAKTGDFVEKCFYTLTCLMLAKRVSQNRK